jgi:hypothetical protein
VLLHLAGDKANLVLFSNIKGHSAAIARSILMQYGYRFDTEYVLPSAEEERQGLPSGNPKTFEELTVYPNPGTGDEVLIFIPQIGESGTVFSLWNVQGQLLFSNALDRATTSIKTPFPLSSGVYIYRINQGSSMLKCGRLIVNKKQ